MKTGRNLKECFELLIKRVKMRHETNSPSTYLLLISLLLFTFTSISAAQPLDRSISTRTSDAPAPDSLTAKVDSMMAPYDTTSSPGAVIGVVKDGEVIFSRGYGMADLTHQVPITTDTRFNIASISKQFTGFAFSMLAEQGKLSLDDPARKYLSELPAFEDTVTLRHMLTHTSGYREAYGTLALRGLLASRDYLSRDETLEVIERQPALEFIPGSNRRYNSTAYVVLAMILEEVTDDSYPRWMQQHVFDPIGMRQTVIEDEVGEIIPGSATSYYYDDKDSTFTTAYSNRAIFGSAEIYTTVGDLARWMQNFHTAEVGGKSVQDRLREPFVLNKGDTTNYGLGIVVDRARGLERVHHSGSHAGYGSKLNYYPELNAGVIVMTNHGDFNSSRTARKVAKIFFGQHMDIPEKPKEEPEQKVTVDSTLLAQYAQRYRANKQVMSIRQGDNKLYLRRSQEQSYTLKPTSDSTFTSAGHELSVTFYTNTSREVTSATLKDSTTLPLQPIGLWNPTKKKLQSYEGRYVSPELETIYTVTATDSQLVARHRLLGTLHLQPVQNALETGIFTTLKGTIQPRIRFEQNKMGIITGFYASLWRTDNVWFQKQ